MKLNDLATKLSDRKQSKSTWLSKLKQRLLFFLIGLCLVSLLTPQLSPVIAQDLHASIKDIIEGNEVFIQERQAKVNDIARLYESVTTGNASVALLFSTQAETRLEHNAKLTVGSSCVEVVRGSILVNGQLNGCTPTAFAAVRGTTYVLEVDDNGNQKIIVLEGEVIVKKRTKNPSESDRDPTSKPSTIKQIEESRSKQLTSPRTPRSNTRQTNPLSGPSPADSKPVLETDPKNKPSQDSISDLDKGVVLKEGEKLEVDRKGTFRGIRKLTLKEFEGILTGNLFRGFTTQLRGIDKLTRSFNKLFPGVKFPVPKIRIPPVRIPRVKL